MNRVHQATQAKGNERSIYKTLALNRQVDAVIELFCLQTMTNLLLKRRSSYEKNEIMPLAIKQGLGRGSLKHPVQSGPISASFHYLRKFGAYCSKEDDNLATLILSVSKTDRLSFEEKIKTWFRAAKVSYGSPPCHSPSII